MNEIEGKKEINIGIGLQKQSPTKMSLLMELNEKLDKIIDLLDNRVEEMSNETFERMLLNWAKPPIEKPEEECNCGSWPDPTWTDDDWKRKKEAEKDCPVHRPLDKQQNKEQNYE